MQMTRKNIIAGAAILLTIYVSLFSFFYIKEGMWSYAIIQISTKDLLCVLRNVDMFVPMLY